MSSGPLNAMVREWFAPDRSSGAGPRSARHALVAMASIGLATALALVLCDRWDAIPWTAKFLPVLALMLAAHVAGWWLRFRLGDTVRGDRLFLAGTVGFGASVFLCADRMHIAAQFPWGLFVWAAGALPLALVLGSRAMLFGTLALGTAWFVWLMALPEPHGYWLFLALAAFLIDRAYRDGSRALLSATLAALVLWWALVPVAEGLGRQGWFLIALLGPLLVLVGRRHGAHPLGQPYYGFGIAIVIAVLPALALPSVARDVLAAPRALAPWLPLAAIPALLLAIDLRALWRRERPATRWQDYGAAALLLVIASGPPALYLSLHRLELFSVHAASLILAAVFQVAVIAIALGMVAWGGKIGRAGLIAGGIAYAILCGALVCLDLRDELPKAALVLTVASAASLGAANYVSRWQEPSHEGISGEGS